MIKRLVLVLVVSITIVTLSACAFLGGDNGEAADEDASAGEEAPTDEPTAYPLAPTLGAAPADSADDASAQDSDSGDDLAPTAIPTPTELPAQEEGEEETNEDSPDATTDPASVGSGPGISIDPAMGEPGEIIFVYGSGFEPGADVDFYWASVGGEIYTIDLDVEADEKGEFVIAGLIVPPADKWPGGPPQNDGDLIILHAYSTIGDYWASFTYLKRFNPVTSLVQTYSNADYGYEIDLPNAWTWSWTGEDTSNVRFSAPSGRAGKGFIRIANTTNVTTAIQAIMPLEAPGETYTTTDITSGSYPGTQVTTSGGLVVWFIPSGGRTYAVSFMDDEGNFYELVAVSFRLV